jgi:hypothetical protein
VDAILGLASEGDNWGDLIDWLCDPEGTESFLTSHTPLQRLLLGATDDDLRELRLAAEICPVHHVDAAICADDFGGTGAENCCDPAAAAKEGHAS